MTTHPEHTPLAEEIHAIFSRLTHGESEEFWSMAQRLADSEEPRDHWLQTGKMDPAVRLFLSAATALSMRNLDNPYKCAVLTRDMAETIAHAR